MRACPQSIFLPLNPLKGTWQRSNYLDLCPVETPNLDVSTVWGNFA
jgi:hypothetical protein